jgi:hypothetical protein
MNKSPLFLMLIISSRILLKYFQEISIRMIFMVLIIFPLLYYISMLIFNRIFNNETDVIGMVHEVTFHQRNENKVAAVGFVLKDNK